MTRIETKRLLLRNFVGEDWGALREIILGYAASEMAAYDHTWPTAPEKVREAVASFVRGDTTLAVELRSAHRLIGLISMPAQPDAGADTVGFGYLFDFRLHRQGYATEACRAMVAHAFDVFGIHRIATGCADANAASGRLLARLGFRKTAPAMHSFGAGVSGERREFAAHRFELTAADWYAAASAAGRAS